MNNSNTSGQRSNEKNTDSGHAQVPPPNCEGSSGDYYYSSGGEKSAERSGSKSDIIKQHIQPHDFKPKQKADT